MMAFYRGQLDQSEELAELCVSLAADLPGEDGMGTYGLRMFLIRREQDRLGMVAPMIRHLMAANPAEALWVNESRLWMSRVRRAQGHADEADAIAAVVAEQTSAAGLPRLHREAAGDLDGRPHA